jgi:hypothetical protein
MKLLYAGLVTIVLAVCIAVGTAQAQEPSSLSDDHVSHIKNNCQPTSATLTQIRTNDGLVFVNRNQAYFSISDKLIARLNSRLALERYDTASLARIGEDYNAALADFRVTFKRYSDTMTDLVRMDCHRNPVGFYDKVAQAREQRAEVRVVVAKLHDEIEKYREAVNVFKTDNESRLKGNVSE